MFFLLFLQGSDAVAMGSLSSFAMRPAPEPIHVSEGTLLFFWVPFCLPFFLFVASHFYCCCCYGLV